KRSKNCSSASRPSPRELDMHRALLLLLRLRLNSWFRRLSLNVKTARGAVLTIVSALVVAGWFGSLAVGVFVSASRPADAGLLANAERFGPLALVAYCLLVVVTSSGGPPALFTQAEVQFLF